MANELKFKLTTALSTRLTFLALDGGDEISRLFEYSVLAEDSLGTALDLDTLIGRPAELVATPPSGPARHVHGIVASATFEGIDLQSHRYRLTLRPWLWLATRSSDVRIFQQKTVKAMVETVLQPYGPQLSWSLEGSYRAREYCVQYRESDFNFVSRLLEEEGIFYFFRHEAGKHTLVLSDGPQAHVLPAGMPTAALQFRAQGRPPNTIVQWRWSREVQTKKVSLREDVWQRPQPVANAEQEAVQSFPPDHAESYDYPAGVAPWADEASGFDTGVDQDLKHLAQVRLQAQQARHVLAEGEATALYLATGGKFKLAEHPLAAQNAEYVVLAQRLHLAEGSTDSGHGDVLQYRCLFSAFPSEAAFRPLRLTPKPTVAGPQTALVTGPDGEELYVDKHGRVKVMFHWNRDGTQTQADASCFVRVAQPAAGKGFGMMMLPRVGQEVVVEFLEGDPDRPLITGAVYNGVSLPPYALPEHKQVSTLKSRSTKQGAAADFNELRFDDTKGGEYLLLHAQKDRFEFVEGTLKAQIGIDSGEGNEHRTVKNDRKEKIGGEYHLAVTKVAKQKFADKLHIGSADDMLLKSGGVFSLQTTKDITAKSGATISMKSTGDMHLKIGGNIGAEASQNVYIKGGVNIVIEGGMQISIKAGGSSVVLGPDGVSITGAMVKINSGGSAGSGTAPQPVAPTDPEDPAVPDLPQDPLSHR